MRKIIAAGLAAALSLSIAPVASAQLSSLGSLSSSSSAITPTSPEEKRNKNAQDLEAALASIYDQSGGDRSEEDNDVAQATLEKALEDDVEWIPNVENEVEAQSTYWFTEDHVLFVLRVAHSDVQKTLSEVSTVVPEPEDLDADHPYGLASDADEDWAYVAIAFPRP